MRNGGERGEKRREGEEEGREGERREEREGEEKERSVGGAMQTSTLSVSNNKPTQGNYSNCHNTINQCCLLASAVYLEVVVEVFEVSLVGRELITVCLLFLRLLCL